MSQKVAVIGAGIVGACSALSLRRAGFDVVLIDPEAPGSGCSYGNAGNISPGSVAPYSMPGSLRRIPGWLFNPLGPLSIRPAHFLRFVPWGVRWLRESSVTRALEISRSMRTLHGDSLLRYDALLSPMGQSHLIRRNGQLYVSRTPRKALGSMLEQFMREAARVPFEVLEGGAVRELEPALAPQYTTGLLLPDNGGCVNPQKLVQVLVDQACAEGVTQVRDRVMALPARPQDGRLRLPLATDTLSVDHVVVAAGSHSRELCRSLGLNLPLEHEYGYHVSIQDSGVTLRMPVANKDIGFACSSMETGLRLAGTAEYAGVDATPRWQRADNLLTLGKAMFPGLRTDVVARWMGARPSFPDGLPVVDRLSAHGSVWGAFGNGHFGMTAAPMMGQLITDLVSGRTPAIPIAPFRAARFGSSLAAA